MSTTREESDQDYESWFWDALRFHLESGEKVMRNLVSPPKDPSEDWTAPYRENARKIDAWSDDRESN